MNIKEIKAKYVAHRMKIKSLLSSGGIGYSERSRMIREEQKAFMAWTCTDNRIRKIVNGFIFAGLGIDNGGAA